jgi:hypothetical protein
MRRFTNWDEWRLIKFEFILEWHMSKFYKISKPFLGGVKAQICLKNLKFKKNKFKFNFKI